MAITHETGSRLFGLLASALAVGITSTLSGSGYAQIAPQDYGSPYGSVLQSNDQGNAVVDLQQRLSGLGYYHGPVTGYFDTSTQEAVRQFQQANGLAADGVVGAATISALDGHSSVQTDPQAVAAAGGGTVQIYDSGNQVSSLQQQLSQLGYYTGAVTGVFDSTTQAAVMNFQRDRGLATDGIVGSATLSALAQPTAAPSPVSPTYTPTAAATAVTPAATPSNGLLQLGDMGSEVSTLQSRLQSLGYYDGPISGSFGSQTQTALVAFQQAQGLTADGIAGPQVNAALGGVTSTPNVATATASPATMSPATVSPAVQPAVIQPTTQPVAPVSAAAVTPTPVSSSLTSPAPELAPTTTAAVQVPSLPPLPPADPTLAERPNQPNSARQQAYRNPEGNRFGVAELQRRLEMRGFDPGQPGVYDSATQEAILKAQQAYGISGQDLEFQR
jgi:peptidoglycan hydrolase-like protein with peptidoglycan-binding domain